MAYSSEPSGNKSMAFILGAVVVAVLVLGYFIMGGDVPAPAAVGDGGGNTTVTIENPAPAEPPVAVGTETGAPAAGDAAQNN